MSAPLTTGRSGVADRDGLTRRTSPQASAFVACLKVARHLDRLAEQGKRPTAEDVAACQALADRLDRLAEQGKSACAPTVSSATINTERWLAMYPSGPAGATVYLAPYWHTADRRYPKVHTLVRHGPDGRPVGQLTYFPHDRTATLCVAPAYRRQGIADALSAEANRRWDIAPGAMTPDGAAWVAAYLSRALKAAAEAECGPENWTEG